MKTFLIPAFHLLFSLSLFAQVTAPDSSLEPLLDHYYEIKNALVRDDPDAASKSAEEFLSFAKNVNIKNLSAAEQKAFAAAKEQLVYNADHISEVQDLDHQREHFEALSLAMSKLAQSVSLSQQPIYINYCPMKKAYWLSSDKAIQNPYYGKQMSSCGSVTKTLMPGEHSILMNETMDIAHSMHMSDTIPEGHMHHDMNNMQMEDSSAQMHEMHNMNNMEMQMNMSHSFSLHLPMSRNGSGTGWSPDAAPMYGSMYHSKTWMYMLHYNLFLRYNNQDLANKGSRGDQMVDMPNWLMFMGQKQVGEKGLFRFGTMFSIDALITGQKGYPLLFQTGESAHGEPLVDRQHPHDLFSELSAAYSYAISEKADVFGYVGYPGEPALGPVAFMHRASALYDPDAPITHHWIDATHITFGVATLGVRMGQFKLEGSSFTGREPDENRYDLDKPRFDSWSGRLSFNPSKNWALQVSHAFIKSPEALHPDENVNRTTASAEYSLPLKNDRWFNATAVWGVNKQEHKDGGNAVLLEASYNFKKLALFGKYEYVQKSTEELALDETIYGDALFPVNAFTLGFNYDLLHFNKTQMAVGSHFTLYHEDKTLFNLYGKNPAAFEVYIRIYPRLMKM